MPASQLGQPVRFNEWTRLVREPLRERIYLRNNNNNMLLLPHLKTTRRAAGAPLILKLTLLSLLASQHSHCLDNGLALRPPMGWLQWERFTCQLDCQREPENCISESLFLSMAHRMVQDGYLEAGYEYVNIDDCWSEMERDGASGRLVANSSRFPSGLSHLAGYMHANKLKLGLYGDCGPKTCAGYPGQLKAPDGLGMGNSQINPIQDNYFKLDAETLADWRIDSFKFDNCHMSPEKAELVCPWMGRALKEAGGGAGGNHPAGRLPILVICEWPFYMMYAHLRPNFTLASETCNVWRYYDDIEDSWLSILNTIDYTVKHQSTIVKYQGPGHWFDPDQLVIGNFGLSLEQSRAQMALWCVWSAPLYMSNDLRNIRPEFAKILKNKHLIKVDQDPMGVLGLMVASQSSGDDDDDDAPSLQAFVKPILPTLNSCPSFAIVYLNRKTLGNKQKVSFKLADLLLAAPIYRAAESLAKIQEQGGRAGAGELVEESLDAKECLRRLTNGARKMMNNDIDGDNDDTTDQEAPKWQAFDLFDEDRKLGGELGLHSTLDLVVAPSGVAAIRLQETTRGRQASSL